MTVPRGAVFLAGREFTHSSITIALARCLGPGVTHRIRVLPADLLPRKTYSIPGQEILAAEYLEEEQGLRKTLATFTGDAPHPTTLHGWVGGMGRLARERAPDPPGPPFSVVRREVDERISSAFSEKLEEPVSVSPDRLGVHYEDAQAYEARRDDIDFATRLLRAARAALPEVLFPLAEIVRLLLEKVLVAPPSYWARIPSTPIRHPRPSPAAVEWARPAREAPT